MKKIHHEALKTIAYIAVAINELSLLPNVTQSVLMGTTYANFSLSVSSLVGRIGFPIFAFLIGEGYEHTHDKRRYALRLLLCAIVTEPAFDFSVWNMVFWYDQNPVFTLLCGYLIIWALDGNWKPIWKVCFTAAALAVAHFAEFNYDMSGAAMVVLFWLSRRIRWPILLQLVAVSLPCVFLQPPVCVYIAGEWINGQWVSLLALVPISLYSGKKLSSKPFLGRLSYLVYPAIWYLAWGLRLILY